MGRYVAVAVAVGVLVGRLRVIVSVVLLVGGRVTGVGVSEGGVRVRVECDPAMEGGEKVLLHERVQEPLRYLVPVWLLRVVVGVPENVLVPPTVAVSCTGTERGWVYGCR